MGGLLGEISVAREPRSRNRFQLQLPAVVVVFISRRRSCPKISEVPARRIPRLSSRLRLAMHRGCLLLAASSQPRGQTSNPDCATAACTLQSAQDREFATGRLHGVQWFAKLQHLNPRWKSGCMTLSLGVRASRFPFRSISAKLGVAIRWFCGVEESANEKGCALRNETGAQMAKRGVTPPKQRTGSIGLST